MSIRGIDGQMINRTAEFARDASAQIRQGTLVQDYLALHNKVLADQQRDQVAQLQGAEPASIKLDERKEPDGQAGGRKRKKKQTQKGNAPGGFVPDDPNVGVPLPKRLDIEI